jgi:hypothetical protein
MAGTAVETKQEGSRWLYAAPDPNDVAFWFKENARLHEGMDPANYIGGLQLISQTEKVNVTQEVNGAPAIIETERLVFTPYVRIDARIRYFWDLCELKGWVGEITPAPIPRRNEAGVYNENLGAGFFRYPVKRKPGGREEEAHFIGCSMQVHAYEPNIRFGGKGRTVFAGPPATKVVPMLFKSGWEDPNAPMRAETGAIGRALGLAGILIIPGAGIATAEDMQEVVRNDVVAQAPAPELPEVKPAGESKAAAQLIEEAIAVLEERAPDLLGEVRQWMNSREFVLGKLTPQQERTVLRKLEDAVKKCDEPK